MFQGRTLLIATKHHKEKVIAPLMKGSLGVNCLVTRSFDTDTLGTFSGEVERKDDPITTARNKCLKAMELYGGDLAIASEGSFGPHPSLLLVPADDELLLLLDKKNGLEILARELTTETNYCGEEIRTEKELHDLANRSGFPGHGLIIRKSREDHADMTKGITDRARLVTTFRHLLEKHGAAYVETDMRAMYNPSRMKAIEKATHQLIDRIHSRCPSCQTPGFGITAVKRGLPCRDCGFPTEATLSHVYSCSKCHFHSERMHPRGVAQEDPMYCGRCNP